MTIVAVSVYNITNVAEERYVFFVAAPIALLAAAALEHLDALRRWIVAAGAIAVWLLVAGLPFPAVNAGSFFNAPAGATWTRAVDHRLRSLEDDLFGWLFIPATGWLLIALTVGALVLWIGWARRRPRLRVAVIAAGLAVCLVAQLAFLGYALDQELDGTTTQPGGIALSADRDVDREAWVDATIPDGATAALMPGLPTVPPAYAESVSFWGKKLTGNVAMDWNGAPVPAPPGAQVLQTEVGPDGLARWEGTPPQWLVAAPDDPRMQFAGRVAARSPNGLFEALELTGAPTAAYTASGTDPAGGLAAGQSARIAVDRAQLPDVRTLELALSAPAAGPVRWQVVRDGDTVARGRIAQGDADTATVPIPACDGDCAPLELELRVSGEGALRLDTARLGG